MRNKKELVVSTIHTTSRRCTIKPKKDSINNFHSAFSSLFFPTRFFFLHFCLFFPSSSSTTIDGRHTFRRRHRVQLLRWHHKSLVGWPRVQSRLKVAIASLAFLATTLSPLTPHANGFEKKEAKRYFISSTIVLFQGHAINGLPKN